jgi:hypothetical protein
MLAADSGTTANHPRDNGRGSAFNYRPFSLLCWMHPRSGRRRQRNRPRRAYHTTSPSESSADRSVNFPILMATWKLAPALAAGNCASEAGGADPGVDPGAGRADS